ncbi:hypothetical protein [Paraburkholderia humisilvae]|uniref:DUF3761 domain-containing protein n=1 Tax=Paraburkholderia humisilvae TaxID=627669 RepID=A0A6J5DGW0_9BURK|nr:hypothetical protein [Paraburkholderia humisilvae]CAB3752412.1 hypothetical protein LMG29542_01736 [Paraburkholderia humisilvae]
MNQILRAIPALALAATSGLLLARADAAGPASAWTCGNGETPHQVDQTWRCPGGKLATSGASVASTSDQPHVKIGGGGHGHSKAHAPRNPDVAKAPEPDH